MTTLDTVFEEAEVSAAQADEALSEYEATRQARDRSVIAYIVVAAFVGLITLITCGTLYFTWGEWGERAEFLLKMLSSVLLPVVTLVIGYYFGKDQRES